MQFLRKSDLTRTPPRREYASSPPHDSTYPSSPPPRSAASDPPPSSALPCPPAPLPPRRHAHVAPNALDATAVDWVNAADLPSPVAPGAAVRLTLAKVKEGVEVGQLVEKVAEVTKAAGEGKGSRVSFGENFSPARSKGYQFGMLAVFDSVEELDALEGDGKVEEAKAALRPLLDEVVVLDFVVDAPAAASL